MGLSRIVTENFGAALAKVTVVFVGQGLVFGAQAQQICAKAMDHLQKAVASAQFEGKSYSVMEVLAPQEMDCGKLILVGVGKAEDAAKLDFPRLGGIALGTLGKKNDEVLIFADFPAEMALDAQNCAQILLGAQLRSYSFETYRTKRKEGDEKAADITLRIAFTNKVHLDEAFANWGSVAEGNLWARQLVNEPGNILGPEEFAQRTLELSKLGVEVEILDKAALEKIGMRALLGVSQGSKSEPRVVIMRWKGGNAGEAPLAVIGKGVTFDSGGISLKPGQGMEDMKGDMGGAAAVVGLMHALAGRKAKANVVGLIGLTENMPDGNAQRPGDIVTSLSGQTIEIINTDAEGRLVLADVLWYAQEKEKPSAMINLATLTGAIIVALGNDHAGLFSSDDTLATRLSESGAKVGEKLWRLPLGPAYDKIIDSRFADMKNSGGRLAGSITAAQFLWRYTNGLPWAHLDIAGVSMDSPQTDICKGWANGFGVRLLNQLVLDYYEAA